MATAFATTPLFLFVCRFFTGAGIGGGYAAINSRRWSLAREAGEPVPRQELARRAGARFWGPRRFRTALREAVREGRLLPAGHGRYVIGRS